MKKRVPRIPVVVIHAEWPPQEDGGATRAVRECALSVLRQMRRDPRLSVISLIGARATRANVEHALTKIESKKGLVVFYGHGCMCGESLIESQIVLREESDTTRAAISEVRAHLLWNKIVYVVACYSAKSLGLCLVNKSGCYLGYRGRVMVTLGDTLAPGFEKCVNAGLRILLEQENATCGEAWKAIRDTHTQYVLESIDHDDVLNAWVHINNRNALSEPLGNSNARLYN